MKTFLEKMSISDTLGDTQKNYVSMNINFRLRHMVGKEKKSLIYLVLSSNKQRERINTGIYVDAKSWDLEKQHVRSNVEYAKDVNLILDNIKAKISGIRTVYRLSETPLSATRLRDELNKATPNVDFIKFVESILPDVKLDVEPGTYRRYLSVINKLKVFQKEIFFSELDLDFIDKYKTYLRKKKNSETTINSNMATIKKFLNIAETKKNIKLMFNVKHLKVGTTRGNRISLTQEELKILYGYYFSCFISDSDKLTLGYFLFACATGLRFSDVIALTRKDVERDYITFVAKKTKKDQSISLNNFARKIVECEPRLFQKKYTGERININLKSIFKLVKIHKRVSFHVSRHTFATTFLRAGGKVEKLQKLLGHSNINETMIYVHIVNSEANKDIFLFDDFLDF